MLYMSGEEYLRGNEGFVDVIYIYIYRGLMGYGPRSMLELLM